MKKFALFCISFFVFATFSATFSATLSFAGALSTNETVFSNPPSWLTETRINTVVANIQKYLEWDIRKVKVEWYQDQEAFQKVHGFNSTVLAVSKKKENTIYLGPRVIESNFDSVFGHELVHIIVFQKYKDAIPGWLNEGLANYVGKQGRVDYQWLNSEPFVEDVKTLVHPFGSLSADASESTVGPRYHYQASTALIEMIADKCSLRDLLQLSVGKKMDNYLSTFCGISDINSDFRAWVRNKKGG